MAVGLACASVVQAGAADAVLVRLGAGAFNPQAAIITFSEQSLGTEDPMIALPTVDLGEVTVSFGGHFVGQTAAEVSSPPPVVSLVDSTPTGPLALDPDAPATFITTDASNPTSPVLSGTPTFNGPISMQFSTPVAAVGLDGGFFNAIGGTSIEAYDAGGNVLGSVQNAELGIEFFGLADSTGNSVISGVSFFITGEEGGGFGIDNVTFGSADVLEMVIVDFDTAQIPLNFATALTNPDANAAAGLAQSVQDAIDEYMSDLADLGVGLGAPQGGDLFLFNAGSAFLPDTPPNYLFASDPSRGCVGALPEYVCNSFGTVMVEFFVPGGEGEEAATDHVSFVIAESNEPSVPWVARIYDVAGNLIDEITDTTRVDQLVEFSTEGALIHKVEFDPCPEGGTGCGSGIDTLMFGQIASVPEPGLLPLGLTGCGVVLLLARRRHKARARA